MSESLENQMPLDNEPVTIEDLTEVIQEFETYRKRLIDDMNEVAQKAKIKKSKMMSRLEPELAKIDETLEKLRSQQATLSSR